MELISLAAAITLTQWSERTFWRKFADGSMARKTGSGKAMIPFELIEPHLCMSLGPEDLSVLESADGGSAAAQNDLAVIFLSNGKPKGAIYWLELAIKQDFASAMYLLGRCYSDGNGLPKNENLSIMWIAKAASYGHTIAQAQMQAVRDQMTGANSGSP